MFLILPWKVTEIFHVWQFKKMDQNYFCEKSPLTQRQVHNYQLQVIKAILKYSLFLLAASTWQLLVEKLCLKLFFFQESHQKTSCETLRSTSDQCSPSRLTMKHFIPNTTKNLAQKKVNLDVLKSGQKLRKRSLRESFNMNFFKLWKLRREGVSTFHCWLEILYRLFLMKCKE